MGRSDSSSPRAIIAEEVRLSLVELCHICRVKEQEVRAWVVEGVLEPEGSSPSEWRFAGSAIRRARAAYRLSRDLEVNLAGIALALDLLDEIAALHARLGARPGLGDPASSDSDE